jgi:hypothetical protein
LPYDSEYLALRPSFRRTGLVSLTLTKRSLFATLGLTIFQRIFVQLWVLNDVGGWDDLGLLYSELFREERNYDSGEGGDDVRSWPFDDRPSFEGLYDRPFYFGQTVKIAAGIYTRIYTSASGFAVTARNEMSVDTDQVLVSGFGT